MNIFEDAKFGDVFITKHKRTARFICHHPQSGTYSLWLVDTDKVFHYKPDGTCVQGEELNIINQNTFSLSVLRERLKTIQIDSARLSQQFDTLCLNACDAAFCLSPQQVQLISRGIFGICDYASLACGDIDRATRS